MLHLVSSYLLAVSQPGHAVGPAHSGMMPALRIFVPQLASMQESVA